MTMNNTADSMAYWYRKILNAYWIIVLISVIAEIAVFFIIMHNHAAYKGYYLIHIMTIPTSLLLAIMLLNEALSRIWHIEKPFIIVFSGSLIAAVLIASNPIIHGIEAALLLPLLVSLFYFEKKLLTLTLFLNIGILFLLYAVVPLLQEHVTVYELFAHAFILCGGFAVEWGIVSRGIHLVNHLTKTIQSEQELLIKNVVMDRLSKIDALTELYNHKTFHEYLDKLVEHGSADELTLHLAILDIDNFKKINDTYGHATGDVVLKRVAQTISESVSPNEIVARYGGEEFAIIFTATSLENAYHSVERMREKIYAITHPEMEDKRVSVSIGLTSFRKGSSKSELFAESDALLYEAKRSGKNKTSLPAN